MTDRKLQFSNIKASKIRPNPRNPRIPLKPGMPMYEKLRANIERFDYIDPIVVNDEDGQYVIISGHQRFQVMKDIAEENGEELQDVSVVVQHLSAKERDILTISLNKITGIWDMEMLAELFNEMSDEEREFTGFDDFEIEGMLTTPKDLEGLFEDSPQGDGKKPNGKSKMITCPHCGKEFEI